MRQDAIVGILGAELRDTDAESASSLHALENRVDAIDVPLLHAAQRGQNVVLFAYALFGPFHRNSLITGIGFDQTPVIVGALPENLLAHHRDAENLREEVHHLLGPGQTASITF